MPSTPLLRARPRRWLALLGPCLVLLLASAMPIFADGPVNSQCPVLPDDPLEEGTSLHYGDHEIGFCCDHCRGLFLEDPAAYLDQLPPEAADAVRAVHFPAEKPFAIGDHPDLVTLGVLGLLALLGWGRGTEGGRRLAFACVALGLVGLAALSWWRAEALRVELAESRTELELARWKELIHNNTYYTYGDPPRPLRPPVEPRLAATFYRGNDERSDRLFNGGNYLTAYLDLAIVDEAGEPIEHGQQLGDQPLFLQFQIRRGPNTPDFFWTDDLVGDIFLTAEPDPFLGYEEPVPDRRDLETVEPMERWRATYPVGFADDFGEKTLEKTVYVADAWFENGRMIGATFHYGIEVKLAFEDGRVEPRSEVYMGALFRPRKSPISRVPANQWLSHEPLLPLPEPQGDDPETLGIDDYLDGTE